MPNSVWANKLIIKEDIIKEDTTKEIIIKSNSTKISEYTNINLCKYDLSEEEDDILWNSFLELEEFGKYSDWVEGLRFYKFQNLFFPEKNDKE